MRFGMLGPLAVWTDSGEPVPIPERKVRALLIDLLLHEGRPISADRLADDIWEGDPPTGARNTLQTKVSQLRRALAEGESGAGRRLTHVPAGYILEVAPDEIDAGRFAAMGRRARRASDPREREGVLTQALALWRGPALADVADASFARIAIARLEEQRLTALEELAEAGLELGRHTELATELSEPVARHPLRERLRAAHMLALHRAGRRGEALAAYADLRRHLARELGVEPGPEVAALERRIREGDPTLAPLPSRTNLPATLTPLIGRDAEVARVRRLLQAGRLVTLTGPGGVGKTRLAIEAAGGYGAALSGAWLVELGGVEPGADPVQTVTTALGLRDDVLAGPGGGGAAERLAAALTGSSALLVLDNCEHLLEAVATLTQALLHRAPDLRVLATSREPLGLAGEIVYTVPPLPTASAIELFVARVATAAPEVEVDSDDGGVAELCRRLDGIPLALELAAARVRGLGLTELVARLGDRFRLLGANGGAAPARQRTLRATMDWSWDLLSEPERAVLRHLTVHSESFSLEAGAAVAESERVTAADAIDLIARLVDRSLVTRIGDRYRLLETVAEYGAERLAEAGEADAVRARHLAWYAAWAERAAAELHRSSQRHYLECMDAESPNLDRALDGAVRQGRRDDALRLANATTWHRFLRGRLSHAVGSLDAALGMAGEADPVALAQAWGWRDGIAALIGEAPLPAPDRWRLPCVARVGGRARALWFRGFVECDVGDLRRSEALVREALAEAACVGDRWAEAAALSTMAKQAMIRGDLDEVERQGTDSLDRFRELGDRWGQLQAIEWLGALARSRGEYAAAEALHREGLGIAEELGLWPQAADQLSWLGRVAMHRGDMDRAWDLLRRASGLAAEQRYRPGETFAELGLGLVARRRGRLDEAEAHLRRALERSREAGAEPGVAAVVGLAELGYVAERRGDAAAAEALHRDSLDAARRLGDGRAVARALEGLAGARALAGRHAHAARLLGAAGELRRVAGAPPSAAERGDVERATAAVRAALGAAALERELAVGRHQGDGDW